MAEAEAQTTHLDIICTVGSSQQVSVKLPLSNASEAEVFYADFVAKLGEKVGEVYSSETSVNPVSEYTR